jgi:hypothetical protein
VNRRADRLGADHSGVKVTAACGEGWPSVKLQSGPLTVQDIPRVIFEQRGDLHVVIELGSLANLLSRA